MFSSTFITCNEYFSHLCNVIQHNVRRSSEKINSRHSHKLTNLGAAKKVLNYVDKSHWVRNLSNRELANREIEALQNGFNFATTPASIPTCSILANIENGIHQLSDTAKANIRVSVVNILKNSKLPKPSHTSKQLNTTLKNLKNDPSIVILPADKGRCVVVMNAKEYKEKMRTLLSDEMTYAKITDKRRNPTARVEKDLNKLLQGIKKEPAEHDPTKPQLPDRLYHHLHSTDATAAAFYGLPKIHKLEIPLRPITSCINFSTYNLSSHLVSLISPLQN